MTKENAKARLICVSTKAAYLTASQMRLVIELGLDFVAGIARAPAAFVRLVLRERIATLNHESFDDPMKARPIVESLLGERLEVFHVARSNVRPEFQNHLAFGRFDDSRFAHKKIAETYFTESPGTILMLSMFMRLTGRSGPSVGVVAIFSKTSSPLMSLPKTVYW